MEKGTARDRLLSLTSTHRSTVGCRNRIIRTEHTCGADGSNDKILMECGPKVTVLPDAEVKFDKVSLLQNLQTCFIQPTHCPNYFPSIDYVLCLHDMGWTVVTFAVPGMYHR